MKKLLCSLAVLAAIVGVVLYFLRKKEGTDAWVEEFSTDEEIF